MENLRTPIMPITGEISFSIRIHSTHIVIELLGKETIHPNDEYTEELLSYIQQRKIHPMLDDIFTEPECIVRIIDYNANTDELVVLTHIVDENLESPVYLQEDAFEKRKIEDFNEKKFHYIKMKTQKIWRIDIINKAKREKKGIINYYYSVNANEKSERQITIRTLRLESSQQETILKAYKKSTRFFIATIIYRKGGGEFLYTRDCTSINEINKIFEEAKKMTYACFMDSIVKEENLNLDIANDIKKIHSQRLSMKKHKKMYNRQNSDFRLPIPKMERNEPLLFEGNHNRRYQMPGFINNRKGISGYIPYLNSNRNYIISQDRCEEIPNKSKESEKDAYTSVKYHSNQIASDKQSFDERVNREVKQKEKNISSDDDIVFEFVNNKFI